LAAAGDSNKWLGGAHALDGMITLLPSLWLAIAAWRRRSRSKES
jgi:heme A synthase